MRKLVPNGITKTVTTAGTRVQVSTTPLWAKGSLKVKAPAANAGVVYLGGSGVTAALSFQLAAGDVHELIGADAEIIYNLKDFWVDAATNGDKLSFFYSEEQL